MGQAYDRSRFTQLAVNVNLTLMSLDYFSMTQVGKLGAQGSQRLSLKWYDFLEVKVGLGYFQVLKISPKEGLILKVYIKQTDIFNQINMQCNITDIHKMIDYRIY